MNNVMIDFETLGKGPNKAVCQVAAVYFNPTTGEMGKEFKATIDAESHELIGGQLDADTVYWWLSQSDAARKSILDNKVSVHTAMTDLNIFLSEAEHIWSHATFDFVTLNHVLSQLRLKPTFSYRSARDIRTLMYLAGINAKSFPRSGTVHDALEDCKHQINYCVAALCVLKTKTC